MDNTMDASLTKPSPLRIIQCDYPAMLSAVAPIACWGLYLALTFFGAIPAIGRHQALEEARDAPLFFGLAIIITAASVLLLAWRLWRFRIHYAHSTPVSGLITAVGFFRDRGRVEYQYEYFGKVYQGWNALHKSGRTVALQPGSEVELMVDRDNPAKAFIRDLYV